MSELIKRFLARDPMTLEEEAEALAELERINDERDAVAVRLAIGRKTAWKFSKGWGDGIKGIWFAEALEAAKAQPDLLERPKTLAYEVLERCNAKGINKRNGKPYDHATIRNYLTSEIEAISASLESFTTQASVVESGEPHSTDMR